MKVKLDLQNSICEVIKEAHDPKFSGAVNAAGESRLLYHVKKELIKQGHKVVKKRMWKDGHLVDDLQQYIVTANKKTGFCIYNSNWAIRGAEEEFNQGQVILSVAKY